MVKHLDEINETYINHLGYATRLGFSLLISGVCFIVHGLLPTIQPPEAFNLDSTYIRVKELWEYVNRDRHNGSKEKP